jgi:hypothetical protein
MQVTIQIDTKNQEEETQVRLLLAEIAEGLREVVRIAKGKPTV